MALKETKVHDKQVEVFIVQAGFFQWEGHLPIFRPPPPLLETTNYFTFKNPDV